MRSLVLATLQLLTFECWGAALITWVPLAQGVLTASGLVLFGAERLVARLWPPDLP